MSVPDPHPDPVGKPFDLGSALLILVGAILLLPGLCAIIAAVNMVPVVSDDPVALVLLAMLWAFCLAIGYGGFRLIKRGSRG